MIRDAVVAGARHISRSELLENGRRAARGLREMGIGEGDTIAFLLRNDFAFLEATYAAGLLGVYAVPVNWHLKSEEIAHVLADCDARVLIVHADLLNSARSAIPESLPLIIVPTPPEAMEDFRVPECLTYPPEGALLWPDWRDRHEGLSEAEVSAAPRATMIYTSGTTGRPKGVRREPMTASQTEAMKELFREVYGVVPGMRALVAGPLYHASPNAFARQALAHADVIVLQSRFEAEATLRDIERYRITTLVMVPTMFVRMVKLPDDVKQKYDLSSVQTVTHTAAPCPADVKRAMIEWWGPVLNETYGGTEVGVAVACNSREWLAHPGTVGRPTKLTTLRVYDDEGKPVLDNQPGEIYMRCDAYSDFTYHKQPELRKAIELDGLVSVGDVGYLRDGYLYLCDRKTDMVIAGGVNIYPAEVESCLLQYAPVKDCAIFGIPDEDMGESLMAVVELFPGQPADEAAIKAYLGSRLANYKVPRKIEFQNDLPREDSGKIFKRRLRDPYWKDRHVNI